MPTTGQLGTPSSQLGTVQLGTVPNTGIRRYALEWSATEPIQTDLHGWRGQALALVFTRGSDCSNDLSGKTLAFTVKVNYGDAAATLSRTTPDASGITIDDAVAGAFTVLLTAANLTLEPGVYYFDVQVTDSGSEAILAYGRFTVKAEVRI